MRLFKKYFAKLDSEYLSKQIDNIYKAIDDVVNNITYNPKNILESFNGQEIVFDKNNDEEYIVNVKYNYDIFSYIHELKHWFHGVSYKIDTIADNVEYHYTMLAGKTFGISNRKTIYSNNGSIAVGEGITINEDNIGIIHQKRDLSDNSGYLKYNNFEFDSITFYSQVYGANFTKDECIYNDRAISCKINNEKYEISFIALAQMLEAYYDSAAVADEEGNFKTYKERINDPNDPFYIDKTKIEESRAKRQERLKNIQINNKQE